MRYATYAPDDRTKFPVCVLVPKIMKDQIQKAYIEPFDLNAEDVLVIDLHQAEGKKKTPMGEMRAYIEEELVEALNDCEVEYIVCADADYFKALTKAAKAEVNLGYVMDSPFGPWKVCYAPNFQSIFYDPDNVKAKIAQAMDALIQHRTGTYAAPGADIIHFAEYPSTLTEIASWLSKLHQYPFLACDIEAFSLKHHTAGIGTISFAWSHHEGIAFAVDYVPIPGATSAPYGQQIRNEEIRKLLIDFFLSYKGKLRYHGIAYDAYVLIYQLFMKDILDTEGLLHGLEVMLEDNRWDCTKLITYLATNSCAGNVLKLKAQAQEFAGNYAVDEIEDITKTPLPKLLQYNLVDGLSTNFTFDKHWNTLVADDQLDIYKNLFQPCTWDIIQMQLTGMPVNMKRVKEVRAIMDADEAKAVAEIQASPVVQEFVYLLEEEHVRKRNLALKKKQIAMGDEPQEFNPNSPPQLQMLLYDFLQLPVLAKTDSGLPSTDGDTIKALRHHAGRQEIIDFLDALSDYKAVNKLTTSFLPAMEAAAEGPDGWHYLFGNFNLGGTLSGRLSSSKPNLQNLPSNGKSDKQRYYAKLIKTCFEAPPGWLFCGLDFDSLEDKISGLTTKDPNKLKVYTDGYDGHSLRAFSYFREQMPDILQSEGRRVFRVEQGGEIHYLFEGDQVQLPDGSITSIESAMCSM